MRKLWDAEKKALSAFRANIDARPPLPDAPPEALEEHASEVSHLQDLLSLASSLPVEDRPPVAEWDDLLGPLWRRLFARGADIDRYTLAGLWRTVLLDHGEVERFLRATAAVAASARNFYHFDEALDCCREGRDAARGRPSAALANLINTEGFTRACAHDYDGAIACFREAKALAQRCTEEDLLLYAGTTSVEFQAQEMLNEAEVLLDQSAAIGGRVAQDALAASKALLDQLEKLELGPGFQLYLNRNRAEHALYRGQLSEARKHLAKMAAAETDEGPFRFSLLAIRCRLEARLAVYEGDLQAAYESIRVAIRQGLRKCYPAEEQFVLEEAVSVLKAMHGQGRSADRDGMIRDLVSLMEDKDWYTGRSHARGVSSLAANLGQRLNARYGWNVDLETLSVAGLLHDIGKLRIPWSLLNKIAPITPRERLLLQEHALHGGSLLSAIGMEDVAAVVEQHHETLDGGGYPRGVRPQPLAAILGVCDVYEAAITPNRRYKEPKDPVIAIAELAGASGVLYEPAVVECLMDLVASKARRVPVGTP